jgi:hypothetical protein
VPGPACPPDGGPTVVRPACPPPVAARRRSLRPTRQPQPRAAAAVGPWRQPRHPPRGERDPSPSRAGAACRAPTFPRAQHRQGQGHPPAAKPARPTAAVPPPRPGRTDDVDSECAPIAETWSHGGPQPPGPQRPLAQPSPPQSLLPADWPRWPPRRLASPCYRLPPPYSCNSKIGHVGTHRNFNGESVPTWLILKNVLIFEIYHPFGLR